jgi:hypothetical protein
LLRGLSARISIVSLASIGSIVSMTASQDDRRVHLYRNRSLDGIQDSCRQRWRRKLFNGTINNGHDGGHHNGWISSYTTAGGLRLLRS